MTPTVRRSGILAFPPHPGVGGLVGPTACGLRSPSGQGGSATVQAVVLILFMVGVGLVALAVEGLVADHRRAQSAADLAALAGAAAGQRGEDGCAAAARVAAANGVRLRRCVERSGALSVLVTRDLRSPLARGRTVTAEARAGPLTRAPR